MNDIQPLRRLPLHDLHVACGARMAPFAGYEMPIRYGNIVDEHLRVRSGVGLFDVSHMGQVWVRGEAAATQLNRLVTRDVASLQVGQASYGLLCNERGGILDDLIVYRCADTSFLVCVNAATREADVAWMRARWTTDAELADESAQWGQLALQGPRAREAARLLVSSQVDALEPFHIASFAWQGSEVWAARTGYTGEDGYEFYVPQEVLAVFWTALLQAGEPFGIAPIGLGARDTLRLEARLPLYGSDLTEEVNPLEANLGWTVAWDKEAFVGRDALVALREVGPARRLLGFVLQDKGVLRAGYPILHAGEQVGCLTSGGVAPSLGGASVGLGYVPAALWKEASFEVEIRGKALACSPTRAPFYKRS